MDNLNKEGNNSFQKFPLPVNRNSLSNETSDNQCSTSNLILKNFNHTEIYPIKNKNNNKRRNSKFKLDQSKLIEIPNYNSHFSKPNVYSAIKHLQKSNYISNI